MLYTYPETKSVTQGRTMTNAETEKPVPITIRFPPALVEAVQAKAKTDLRSFNAEIVYLVTAGLAASTDKSGGD